jgi:hypothetical protein
LRVKFKSVEEAEEYINIRYFNDDVPLVSAEEESTAFEKQTFEKGDPNNGEVMDMLCKYYSCLSSTQKIQLISHLFNQFLKENFDISTSSGFVPKDFLEISASALANLYQNEKYNILYYMGKSLKIQKDGGCRLPLNRMPFGLLSHNIMFFGSENVTNLHPEPHFVEWEATMYAHFGHKWAALQRGPMWSSTAYQNDEVDQELPKVKTDESQRKPNSTSNDIVKQALAESVGSPEDQKENIEPNTSVSVSVLFHYKTISYSVGTYYYRETKLCCSSPLKAFLSCVDLLACSLIQHTAYSNIQYQLYGLV